MSVGKIRTWLYSWMMRAWEPRYAERFDRCISVSEEDRRLLIASNPRLQVDVIPNGVDVQMYQPSSLDGNQPALLFIGTMDYPPCNDAALYFVSEILPHIRRVIPNVETWIVGRDPSPEVMQLNGKGVHVTGRVDDVRPYYRRSSVCVVPLRAGGGTRLKILEAMALGRPVVSTTIGCEGLDVVDGEHLLIADTPKLFSEQTVRLIQDTKLCQRITTEARELVVTHYDWDGIAKRLMLVYEDLARNPSMARV
jgi:glycosyltransferase involved in cell wall biosynthesis